MPRLKNKNHERFCQEYVKNERNGKKAYEKVYGKKKTNQVAEVNASQLLRNTKVANRIQELMKKIEDNFEVTTERIIKEYARIAFLDPLKLLNDDGSLRNISDIDEDTRAVIAGMEIESLFAGKGDNRDQIGMLKKIKVVDKKGALDSLSKIRGLFVDKIEVEVKRLMLDV